MKKEIEITPEERKGLKVLERLAKRQRERMAKVKNLMGRPPLSDSEPTVSTTYRSPKSEKAAAQKQAEAEGYQSFAEFIRDCVRQQTMNPADLLLKLNELKVENIRLRAALKGRPERKKGA